MNRVTGVGQGALAPTGKVPVLQPFYDGFSWLIVGAFLM